MSILTQAVDSCPSSFIVFNSVGVIVETNKTTAELFGYTKDELVGSKVERLIPTSLGQHYIQNFFDHPIHIRLGDGKVLTGLRGDGSKIKVEIGMSFFTDKGNTYGVANIVDVTQEHAMSKLVERTQEVARIGSWQVDLKLNKCLWSKMTYKIHKLDERKEVAVEEAINFYALEHRALIRECVEQGVSEGTPWDVELKIITTDNEELWVRAIGAPVYDENEVVGLEGTFQDIHKEKCLRIEREKLFNRLKKTEQLAEMGHWQLTINPEKIEWSEGLYRLWGLSPNQPPPSLEEHARWIIKEDWHVFISTLHHAIEKQEKYQVLFRAKINNEIKYIKGEGTPIFSGANLTGFFGTVRDITSIKNYEKILLEKNESLQRANDELMQFSYRASHDLKSPLVAIRGLAKAIIEDVEDNDYEEVVINANRIASQSETLETFVKDLLELSKIDSSDMTDADIDFEKIRNELINFNQAEAKKADVKMTFILNLKQSWTLPYIRIFQTLNNLVSNSIKYCDFNKKDRFVKLRISDERDALTLVVEDNGLGIPYENKSDAFKMFKRYHANNTSGSGIGMYMVKKHIDVLGGAIDFESSPEGTTFCINIRQYRQQI